MFMPIIVHSNASFPARNLSYTVAAASRPFSPPRGAGLLVGPARWACAVQHALPAAAGGGMENVTVTADGNFTFMPRCNFTGGHRHGCILCATLGCALGV